MPDNIEKREDIRSVKTGKALYTAMLSLLEKNNFRKITVSVICKESLISRASFYSRFTDKYDFLKWWIINEWPKDIVNNEDAYEVKEQKINQYISEIKTIIRNLFFDADSWTLDALFDALHFILHPTADKTIDGVTNPRYIVLSNFCIGGMIHYITWQVKNNFPENTTMLNEHLYKIIKIFLEWS